MTRTVREVVEILRNHGIIASRLLPTEEGTLDLAVEESLGLLDGAYGIKPTDVVVPEPTIIHIQDDA